MRTRAGGRGGAQPALNRQKVADIWIPLAPREEQDEVVREVDALLGRGDAIARRISNAVARTEWLERGILRKALAGDLVTPEADVAGAEGREYESAEALLDRMMRDASRTHS